MIHYCYVSRLIFSTTIALIVIFNARRSEAKDISTIQNTSVQGLVKQEPKEKPKFGVIVKTEQGYMVSYKTEIPGTNIEYEMVPVPGGTFLLGSPKSEKNRKGSEGPQVKVTIAPFWMSKHELTWGEYKEFMKLHDFYKDIATIRNDLKREPKTEKEKKNQAALKKLLAAHPLFNKQLVRKKEEVDAITAPSNLYDPSYTYKSGDVLGKPAVTMSQFAAKQYTKWLSRLSGKFYRLPSEAEWEYACRAGSKSAYHFGDDPKKLATYGWFKGNSKKTTSLVGKLKCNQWGLFDMHGNVAEWVLDGAEEGGYKKSQGKVVWPSERYPRIVRGGSFEFEAKQCRSAARYESDDDDWRDEDPNFPQSPWWFTNEPTLGIGFRIIRPLSVPKGKEAQEKYWKADVEDVVEDVRDRLEDGKGALGHVDQNLPKVIEKLPLIKEKQKAAEK